jgi:ribosomal protein S18 acetylase RimI-like enzyme
VEIRRVTASDWRLLRAVRLRALESDPDAFSSRHDEASARPVEWWREWAARSAQGDQAIFLAWSGRAPIGMAGTFVDEGRRFLFGMWVDPAARRAGVAAALAGAVAAFAREAGDDSVFLDVVAENAAARALYERLGYRAAGVEGGEIRMRLAIR